MSHSQYMKCIFDLNQSPEWQHVWRFVILWSSKLHNSFRVIRITHLTLLPFLKCDYSVPLSLRFVISFCSSFSPIRCFWNLLTPHNATYVLIFDGVWSRWYFPNKSDGLSCCWLASLYISTFGLVVYFCAAWPKNGLMVFLRFYSQKP